MKKKIKDSLGDLKNKVVPASEIPIPAPPSLGEITEGNEMIDYHSRLKAFCKQHKTNPDDLFSWLMDNYGKPKKQSKSEDKAQKNEKSGNSNFSLSLRKAKCGF